MSTGFNRYVQEKQKGQGSKIKMIIINSMWTCPIG